MILFIVAEQMQGPLETTGQRLEAAGAGILQRLPVAAIGKDLSQAAEAFAVLSDLIPQLDASGTLAGQRLAFCADKMTEAGQELQGVQPSQPKGKSWLKGGR